MSSDENIKGFIEDHRDDFDDYDVPEGLWLDIERDIPIKKERMVPLKTVLRIAAGFAILISISIYSIYNSGTKVQSANQISEVNGEELEFSNYPELAEAAFYYQVRIDEATTELSNYKIDEADYESIELLESELESLKDEFGDQVDNERLIEAMMQIYQYKLNMLENMLNQIKNIEKQSDEEDIVVPI